jgi:hypothetical protein
MSRFREVEFLVETLGRGGLDRREFLRRAIATGLGGTTAALVLQACGGGGDPGEIGRASSRERGG